MELILLSPPSIVEQEIQSICLCFENGLSVFHVRKPGYSYYRLQDYLDLIPQKYLSKIVLHSHYQLAEQYNVKGIHITGSEKNNLDLLNQIYKIVSTGCHSFEEIRSMEKYQFEYVFLSPVFNSISKTGYNSGFVKEELKEQLPLQSLPIYALGGVSSENIDLCKSLGFTGVALLGWFWQNRDFKDRLDKFQSLVQTYIIH